MFDYETIKWNIKINKRLLSIFLSLIYFGGIIPMLIMGFYDFPSADDFSMALQTRQYFVQNGDFWGTVWASLVKSYYVYTHYEGYFFSIILTCICPSVFGEFWYFLTPLLILSMLTFGVYYLFDALFVRVWRLDKDLVNSLCIITLLMMVQCMPRDNSRVEAFFWYSGAINYSFTFGMAFFWIGLLFRIMYDTSCKAKTWKIIWACIWGFFLGGANYLTALELAICSSLIILILCMIKTGHFKIDERAKQLNSYSILFLPTILNIIGFAFSCLSPGNAYRSEETNHYSAIKSILLSLYSTFDIMINDMMRWETIVLLILIIPISWKIADRMSYRFRHPAMFVLFSFLLISSNVTAPFYGTANIGAGRLKALAWMEFVFMSSLTMFYITIWVKQTIHELPNKNAIDDSKQESFSPILSMMISLLAGFILIGSGLCIIPEPHYYTTTSALYDLYNGNAYKYKQENNGRLKLLLDRNSDIVGLEEHSVKPELLFYADVTTNSEEWINQATAIYYDKKAVYLINAKN